LSKSDFKVDFAKNTNRNQTNAEARYFFAESLEREAKMTPSFLFSSKY